MTPLLAGLLKLVTMLLVTGMLFHAASAAAHSAFCPEDHEHAPAADLAGGSVIPTDIFAAVIGDAPDHSSDHRQESAVPCHSVLAGCLAWLSGESASVVVPRLLKAGFPTAPVSFASIRPGVDHRPPIAVS